MLATPTSTYLLIWSTPHTPQYSAHELSTTTTTTTATAHCQLPAVCPQVLLWSLCGANTTCSEPTPPGMMLHATTQIHISCSVVHSHIKDQVVSPPSSTCRYRPSLPVKHIAHILAFASQEDCLLFLAELGLEVGKPGQSLDCKACLPTLQAATQ